MITGKTDDLPLFFALHPAFEYIHRFMVEFSGCPKPDGNYTVVEGRIKVSISTYNTAQPQLRKLEAHKKFCDVQVVLRGRERIEYAPLCDCGKMISEEYSRGGDIAFYADPENISSIVLENGSFAVFRPEDAHKPCLQVAGESETVTKAVFKFTL